MTWDSIRKPKGLNRGSCRKDPRWLAWKLYLYLTNIARLHLKHGIQKAGISILKKGLPGLVSLKKRCQAVGWTFQCTEEEKWLVEASPPLQGEDFPFSLTIQTSSQPCLCSSAPLPPGPASWTCFLIKPEWYIRKCLLQLIISCTIWKLVKIVFTVLLDVCSFSSIAEKGSICLN